MRTKATVVRTDSVAGMKLFNDVAHAAPRDAGKRPLAVIGAGFSGTMAVLHLLRQLPPDQPVLLCERAPEFARGVAYATGENDHLLNVRAANMSALADEPNHFADWLSSRADQSAEGLHATQAGLFVSRGLFGQYLRTLLDTALRESAGHARLRLMPDDATDIAVLPGGGLRLSFAGGTKIDVCGMVLAVGNLVPEESADPNICANPWGEKALQQLAPDAPVLIVGTGLTMVDLVVSMRRRGFGGRIVAMSRGGRLPMRHTEAGAWPMPALTQAELNSLLLLMRRIRCEIRKASLSGVDWRAVIDSLRPITAQVWAGMPLAERQRFLRHVRRFWDVHRHRMAPPNAKLVADMQRDGSLHVIAGRIERMAQVGELVNVHYRPRGAANEQVLTAQRVIMASGLEAIERTRDRLMGRLIESGLARVDSHGMGLDVTDSLQLIDASGSPSDRIWALGPIVRGVFWECIAVPDIRVQASQVAASVVAGLNAEAPKWSFII